MLGRKGKNKKTGYKLLSNFWFLLCRSWEMDKRLLVATFLRTPIQVLITLFTTYLVTDIVSLVTAGAKVEVLIGHILVLAVTLLFLQLLQNHTDAIVQWRSFGNRFLYLNLCCEKIMNADYQLLEMPESQAKMQKAMGNIAYTNSGLQQFFSQMVNMGSNLIGILVYSFLLCSFEPTVVVVLFVASLLSYGIKYRHAQWHHKNKDNWIMTEQKLEDVRKKSGDFQAAKDIRLYQLASFFEAYGSRLLKERLGWKKKEERHGIIIDCLTAILALMRDGFAYGFLFYSVIIEKLDVAMFIFYFQMISQYSTWVFGFLESSHALQRISLEISELRNFLDMPNIFNHGKGEKVSVLPPEIEFRNVSFRYPGCEQHIFQQLNFKICPGEKVAIVGANGVGKTTLVKLLCGLYEPIDGEILVNAHRLSAFNREEYYKTLSVVFQDVRLLPVSVAKNIALCETEEIDLTRLKKVLCLSGLKEKVDSLPQKEETLLVKGIAEGSVELSGGETQKLALARALYKNAPVIVLDEPTSALDPIAEKEIYEKYWKMTEKATAVFISHRLSSTRFCDRILFLENGKITEEGTHSELMKKGGSYAKMYELQSHYYQEKVQV